MRRHSTREFFAPGRSLLLATLLSACGPRAARAETSLALKNQSWQEADQRVRVDSQYAQLESDLSTTTHVSAMGLIDAIAGATPTGEKPAAPGDPVPTAHMQDRRKAWDFTLAHQFTRVNVTVGFANSRESDYVSNGWSLNTVTDFNEKNTSLLMGYGRTDDRINEEKLGWTVKRPKTGDDFLLGVIQLLDANTSVTANVSVGLSRGFMSDPYKIVSTTRLDLDPGFYYTVPENRPRRKDKVSLFAGLNHSFERVHGAIDASYRYYHDTFGINSHTVTLLWLQKLGDHVVLQPSIRYYRQSAADFYYFDLDRAGIVTTYEPVLGETGTGQAPFYSSDYRLSYMQSLDLGLKMVWTVRPWLALDAAYNRYSARGLDHVTPQDAFCRANTITLGVKFTY
ncbi:MAG: DUF3570 domain-containing protein [Verrucomicrobia bacterium]|nr:DUF3570 domain-containing protein [Verrucomicrobiota bacterium]